MNRFIEEILTKVFDILDELLGDKYVVMNKYDEIPYTLPSDLDICIDQSNFKKLDSIITHIAKETGLLITQKIWHHYRKCAYILTPLNINKPFRLQLDFFSDFSVKKTPLLIPYQEILNNTRKYGRYTIPSYELEFVFLLMRRIFKNDFNSSHCIKIRDILNSGDINKITFYSESYYGEKYTAKIITALLSEDFSELKKMQPDLLHIVNNLSKKNSQIFYKTKYLINEFKRAIYRIRYPVGTSIALLSPDGGGKSSVYEKLSLLCWGSFHGIEKRYFRPRLLKNIGSYNPLNPSQESSLNPDPHNVKLDNHLKSLIRFLFYNIDFIFGYFFLIKIKEIKKKLIIYDRYYFDYYVDIIRYKYKIPQWLPRLFECIIPKPKLIFILNGSAEIFYERKKELTIEELKRQINCYYQLSKRLKNSYLIDGNQHIDKVTTDITKIILLYKAKVTAKAMDNKIDNKGIPL